jgi:hypothetical protein
MHSLSRCDERNAGAEEVPGSSRPSGDTLHVEEGPSLRVSVTGRVVVTHGRRAGCEQPMHFQRGSDKYTL